MLVALSEQMFGDKTEQLQLRRTVQSYRMYTYGSASEGNDTVVQLHVYTYVPVGPSCTFEGKKLPYEDIIIFYFYPTVCYCTRSPTCTRYTR